MGAVTSGGNNDVEDGQKPHFEQTKRELNLVANVEGVLECHGRIQGCYPVYLQTYALFSRKLVQRIYVETLHGVVGLTMAS